MISPEMLRKLEEDYALDAAAAILWLPETQASILRWKGADGRVQRLYEREPVEGYTLTMVLQPMQAQAWLGSAKIWSGQIGSNTIRLTPPGGRPRWTSESAFDLIHLVFPRTTIDAIAGRAAEEIHERLLSAPPIYRRDDLAANLGRQVIDAVQRNQPFAPAFADAMTRGLIAHLLGRYAGHQPAGDSARLSPTALRRVREYVAEHLDEDIHVGDMARVAGVSESHFAHAFRAMEGVSPYKYLMAARLDRAQQQLRREQLSVLEVALDCGFKEPSHFARAFKRAVGVTPQRYRRDNGCGSAE